MLVEVQIIVWKATIILESLKVSEWHLLYPILLFVSNMQFLKVNTKHSLLSWFKYIMTDGIKVEI